MQRIQPLDITQVDPDVRHMCEDAEKQTGTSISPRTYAKNPMALKALTEFRAKLAKDGTIDPVLRELVRLKIAALNACQY